VTILNLSRRVLGEAAALHPLRVAEVTAPREVLRVRLLARGREGAAEVEGRLDRRAPLPAGLDVVKVPNDGTPAEGVARLCAVLEDAAAG
jgi:ribose 1,5-bisphosphokinase PhnN